MRHEVLLSDEVLSIPRTRAPLKQVSDPGLTVNQAVRLVQNAVEAIQIGRGADIDVQVITANLAKLWHIVERDPGFEIAAADLLEAAAGLTDLRDPGSACRLRRLLRQAQTRLHERVASARLRASEATFGGRSETLECGGISITAVLSPVWTAGTLALGATVESITVTPRDLLNTAVRNRPLPASLEAEELDVEESIRHLARALAPVQRSAMRIRESRRWSGIAGWRGSGGSSNDRG